MLVCMKCHLEYEEGNLYCSNCGGDLVTKKEPWPVKEEKKKGEGARPDGKLVCPKCHILYEKLTSCIRCGAPLVTQSALKEMKESPPPPRKPPEEPRRVEPKQPYAADTTQEPSSIQATEKRPARGLPEDQRERIAQPQKGKRKILQLRVGVLFLIFLVMAGIYFFLNPFSGERIGIGTKSSQKATGSKEEESSTLSKEAVPSIPSTAIPVVLLPQEVDRILDLLENIRQANLKKNINLLMSCYASNFKDLEERRRTALESWSKYNYLDLIYALKVKSLSAELAQVRVEWKMRLIPAKGGQPEEEKSVLDVTLKKERREWKIQEVAPAK